MGCVCEKDSREGELDLIMIANKEEMNNNDINDIINEAAENDEMDHEVVKIEELKLRVDELVIVPTP